MTIFSRRPGGRRDAGASRSGVCEGRVVVLDRLTDAQIAVLSLAVLGGVLVASWIVRERVGPLRRLFIPASVVGGFAVLLLGPQVLGDLTGTDGVFPEEVIDVWRTIPGLMINVVFGAIMIGKVCRRPGSCGAPPHPTPCSARSCRSGSSRWAASPYWCC